MSDDAKNECSPEWERRKQFIRNGFPMPHCGGRRYTMPDDIAEELRVRAAIELVPGTVFERAADEIDRLRAKEDGIDWKHRALCAEAKLATCKRAYARQCCKDLYASGARWKTRPNPMRDDGVFIEEDCEPGKNRTYFPFPHQFEQDIAEEIVYLLNRATDDREKDGRSC